MYNAIEMPHTYKSQDSIISINIRSILLNCLKTIEAEKFITYKKEILWINKIHYCHKISLKTIDAEKVVTYKYVDL